MSLNPKIVDWQGLRVWILGASSGIGAALAARLAADGADLVLSARNEERLSQVAAALPSAWPIPMDVCDPQQWRQAIAQLQGREAELDVVVFNAGTYAPLRAWELTAENARAIIETNLLGVMTGVAAVLPQMLARGSGHIVIVASVAGYRGLPKALAYGPSKAALINFAEILYMDLAHRGIAVSVVNPGFVATPLTAGNDFRMPALISAEEAAGEIVAGLERGKFEIHFPKRFSRALKLLRILPAGLYFRLMKKATGL